MSKHPSDLTFEPTLDKFLARELKDSEGDGLDEKYRKLAKHYFNESPEKTQQLLKELKKEIEKEQIKVPMRDAYLIKVLRAGMSHIKNLHV